MPVTERNFELAGLTLAGREWGHAGQHPVVALHGWLDNAGSFDRLAERLDGCHLVALDSAGHGFSGFRSPDAAYNIWQEVGDACDVAEQMGWSRYTLLGHSRGAAVATLVAGTFPDRIDKLVLIEGALPILGQASDAPALLAAALGERKDLSTKRGRIFESRDIALRERMNGFTPVAYGTAETLAKRSLREVPGGYQWHVDQRLKGKSELRLTPDHARAFIGRVTAPAILFFAEQGPFRNRPDFQELLRHFATLDVTTLPGGHHLHLEGGEVEIAARMRDFLGLPSAR